MPSQLSQLGEHEVYHAALAVVSYRYLLDTHNKWDDFWNLSFLINLYALRVRSFNVRQGPKA